MQERYLPRKLEIPELIRVLVEEHVVMRNRMREAGEAAGRQDFEAVGAALRALDPVFKQHIADEEAQVLGLLTRSLGVKGAEAEILVFRQHRQIYELMKKVGELAALSSAELRDRQEELQSLFEEHARAEEMEVFPKTVALAGKERGP
jgi:hemerythrin-like domain-containing protein